MKYFTVSYIDLNRKAVTKQVSAKNKQEVLLSLRGQGQVLKVSRVFTFVSKRMSLADRLIFFQRLSSMLASRVGASEALRIMEESFSGSIRDAARMLRNRIMSGEELHEAMSSVGPRYFPEAIVAIIKTGAQGGDMAYAIREAARFERELAQVKKESGKGIFSALGGFVIGIVTILVSTMYVAPEIMESSFITAVDDGADIGWVMAMANWTTYVALTTATFVFIMFLFGVVLRPLFPSFVDSAILKIPFYRDMVLAKSNYIVFFGLAVLLKAGLRVEEALSLTISNAPRGELRNDLERARQAIRGGDSTPWPYRMKMLHATDKAALATAQDREQTARTIQDLATQYQMLYQSRIETFVPAMQAFSALFLSLAGFVLFGVSIIPLMQSSSAILGSL